MADTIRILVTLADHADRQLVASALEGEPSLEIAGYAEQLDDWRAFLEQPGDLVVVACYGHDEGVTAMVDYAVKHRPDRPVVVLSEASPNGFLRQAFEAGADDVITLPQSPDQVAFTLQKVIARKKGLAVPGKATAPVVAVLGPMEAPGKPSSRRTSRSRSPSATRMSSSSTSTSSSATSVWPSGSRPNERCTT